MLRTSSCMLSRLLLCLFAALSSASLILPVNSPHAQENASDEIKKYIREVKAAYGKIEKGCPPDHAFKYVDLTGDGKIDLVVDLSECAGFCGTSGACSVDVYIAGRMKKYVKGFGPIPEGQFLVRGKWSLGTSADRPALIEIGDCPGTNNKSCEFPTVWNGQRFERLSARPIKEVAPTDRSRAVSGTGFFITNSGHLITNAHVVTGCSTIFASSKDPTVAKILLSDDALDLALLKIDGNTLASNFRVGVRRGETVAAFGFPLRGVLAEGGNFTIGSVTALSGLRDDARRLQISTPVQPGNSGGPLLDEWGNVVGVVVSRLALEGSTVAPQNVNFAIKAGTVVEFAERGGVALSFSPTGASSSPMKMPDVAERAAQFTVPIICQK